MGLGMWDQLEMSCTFSALQLRRLDSRMLWYAAEVRSRPRSSVSQMPRRLWPRLCVRLRRKKLISWIGMAIFQTSFPGRAG